jgi:hypothetical protein
MVWERRVKEKALIRREYHTEAKKEIHPSFHRNDARSFEKEESGGYRGKLSVVDIK